MALEILWFLAMVPYASLCIEGLTSKMASLGLRHSKRFTLPFWFMVVWPPLWLKNAKSAFFFFKICKETPHSIRNLMLIKNLITLWGRK